MKANQNTQSIIYDGIFHNFQELSSYYKKHYQLIDSDQLSSYQNFLYKKALFGLKMYDKKELQTMHWHKKKRIMKVHKRAQEVINIWKQELVNKYTSNFFEKIFYNSPINKNIKECEYTDKNFISTLTFKELGLKKADVILKLFQEGILPKNYFSLNESKN